MQTKKSRIVARITKAQVADWTGSAQPGAGEAHPRVREELARQGLDLALPILSWREEGEAVYAYRNALGGDPSESCVL